MKYYILLLFLLINCCPTESFGQEFSSAFVSTPFVRGVNVISGEIDQSPEPNVHYEFYHEGWNEVGQESVFIAEGDFSIGKVRSIHSDSLDEASKHVITLTYAPGFTQIHETEDMAIVYRTTDSQLIQAVEHYHVDSSEGFELFRKERLFWDEEGPDPRLVSRVLEDSSGQAVLCCYFSYDEQGQVISEILAGNLSCTCEEPLIIGEDGLPLSNGIEMVEKTYRNSEEEPHSLFKETIELDDCTCSLKEGRNDDFQETGAKQGEESGYGLGSLSNVWNRLINRFFTYFQYLQTSAHHVKAQWNTELKLPPEWGKNAEQIGRALVGDSTYLLMGHSYEETKIGCYGEREINDNVRLTFINGILTTRKMMSRNLEFLSNSHGGIKVHYVFRPTEGWTWDISRTLMIKMAYGLGFRSMHAHLLAQLWRELIEEVGGVDGDGVIIHYAHSLGGTETDRARELLTPEEQKMIRVVTFGSATFIRNIGYQSVINHVSIDDGVSNNFLIDPIGNIRYYLDPHLEVRYHGDPLSWPQWPKDHSVTGPTYGPILKELGKNFLMEFEY